jgi:hypothetical protein
MGERSVPPGFNAENRSWYWRCVCRYQEQRAAIWHSEDSGRGIVAGSGRSRLPSFVWTRMGAERSVPRPESSPWLGLT